MQKGRISVRRELREPDAFMKTIYKVLDYIQEHRRPAIIAAVTLAAAVIIAIGSSWYLHNRRIQAEEALNRVLATLESKDSKNAGELLEKVRKEFGGSKVGVLAAYLDANYRYRQGEFEQAAAIYDSNPAEDRYLSDLQQLGLAAVKYRQEKYGEAAELLEGLQARQSFINENTYILLGLSYEKGGQPEKARATFENMIQLLPNSFFKSWAEEQLVRLRNKTKT